jgi:integrase
MGKYQKGDNWYIDYYVNGRRKREKVGPSKKLAETVLQKRKVQIAEGKFLDIAKHERIRIEDFAETFINLHSKPNKKSWKSDQANLKAILPFFKGRYLYDIMAQDIEKYKAERANDIIGKDKKIAPATVNRELATLKTMFSKAVAWGKLKDNPAKSVQFLREPEGRVRYLEKEEIVKLLAKCSVRLRPIVIVALNTGMRRGEILGLKWHDVDFQRDIISLFDTKNGESRKIPMNAQVRTALIKVRKHPESQYIFYNRKGEPVHDIRKSFFTALTKAGIINFRFHDLRHTFASQLVMAGIDINTTRELLGHKDIRMTLRYSHLSPDHKKRAVDVLSNTMDTIWTPGTKSKKAENPAVSQLPVSA